MDGLHCDGDEDAGDQTNNVACCWRWIVRGREPVVAAGRFGMGPVPMCSDPCCQAPAAKNAETGTRGELGTQYSGAQILVAVRCVRRTDDQVGLSRFFLRASARSRLRRCTLMPKRVSIASRHCKVVSSGLPALRSATKAITSPETLWPALGPRRLGSRPARPTVCRALWAL